MAAAVRAPTWQEKLRARPSYALSVKNWRREWDSNLLANSNGSIYGAQVNDLKQRKCRKARGSDFFGFQQVSRADPERLVPSLIFNGEIVRCSM